MSGEASKNRDRLRASIAWVVTLMRHRAAYGTKSAGHHVGKADAPPDATLAMERLSRALGLSPFEQLVLLLCVAHELNPAVSDLCGKVQGDPAAAFPTFSLAADLFAGHIDGEPEWDALLPDQRLRRFRLVDVAPAGDRPLAFAPLRANEQVVAFLFSNDAASAAPRLDAQLRQAFRPVPELSRDDLSETQAADAATLGSAWADAGVAPVVQMTGPNRSAKLAVATEVARLARRRLYRVAAGDLPAHPADLETAARLWHRESRVHHLCLLIDANDLASARDGTAGPAVVRFLAEAGDDTPIVLAVREWWPSLPRPSRPLEVAKPTPAEQRTAWERLLGKSAGHAPAILAGQFNLDLATIRQFEPPHRRQRSAAIAEQVRARKHLWDEAQVAATGSLDALAQRVDARATWRDIVLPPDVRRPLRDLARQVRHRGRVLHDWGFADRLTRGTGTAALFAGGSGTGKTMAAEVLARSLRLGLHRVDLSAVVSKYIGETEKNIRRLFDAAEQGGTVLFFDEADAMFGKRSEVKDSHDRYANIEVNYLLQRIEAYTGLVILATNMRSALDPAFTRRLRFVINFPFPKPADRARIWRRSFPPGDVPPRHLDYARLSRLDLAGGNIQTVVLNASFRAARRGGDAAVTMPDVMAAARDEYVKLEKPINEADFRLDPPVKAPTAHHAGRKGAA